MLEIYIDKTTTEVPASTNITTPGVLTHANTEENKVFKTLSNKSVSEIEHSVLKNINKKQKMLT